MNNTIKSILITGCSTGIGYETALYLHNKGYMVFATARNKDDVIKLQKLGLTSFILDVTKQATITNTLNNILKITNGTLDVVFNNAGFGQPGAIEDLSTNILKEQFETNVFGLHEVTVQALKIMHAQGYGKIIQHSSVLGLVSLNLRGAYNASKYAIEGLTDTLRLELANTNIDVALLNTGPIVSEFRNNAKDKMIKNIDIKQSRLKNKYNETLGSSNSDVPFTLHSIAVAKIVEKIINSKRVNARYYITKATYILGYLKRILSTRILDCILKKI
ncbi:Putative NAD(P)-dependent oxidoreductase EC-YbbO [hydrothermal vent metagenome]|uniref:NAD(P)-dependent oxidoreductase EC-YbbO n=1 Tax=hydrothermal vent metagenome TaxID=652676 RepID=A0A3B1DS91_9ZZZZ